jgi:N-acetylmuramoyl-L-alanine amidase
MRRTIVALIALLNVCLHHGVHAAGFKAVRIWPSPEYSRVALEFDGDVAYKSFTLKDPSRLVLDLEGVEAAPVMAQLANKVAADDPYIAGIRAALNRPGVTRIVVELKGEIHPQVFSLKPMGEYGYRVVMDLYPASADAFDQLVQHVIAKADAPQAVKAVAETADKPEAKPEAVAKPDPQDYVRLITVAIDAGHGGEDSGATGANGTYEKDVTLAIARRMKAMIDKQPNMRGYLTRDGDYFIPLHERVNRARRVQADLFVSVHADACFKCLARGSSVFALSEKGATSAAAKWLAKHENDADLIGGVNIDVKDVYLKQTLIDLSQTAQISDSLKLGKAVLDQLGEFNDLHHARVEQAGFAVLKAPDIPSILVETAFISNPQEEKRLNDDAYQNKVASAIVDGIKQYFDRNPPLARNKVAQTF